MDVGSNQPDWNSKLQSLLHSLYADLSTVILYDNLELNVIFINFGITQGCPLSGTIFAIALDPLVRSHLANVTLCSAHICLFAGDVALVLRCIRLQLEPLLAHMDRWRKATGLTLKTTKCVVIALVGDLADYERILAREPCAEGMRVVWSAMYLGAEVGPGVVDTQWATVMREMSVRVPGIATAPSMVGRLVLCSS